MQEFMNVIQSRRSTRSFVPGKLPPREDVMQLVEAASWAPSGKGKFLWHFSIVYSADRSLQLARAVAKADQRGPQYSFYNAPVHIIVSYQRGEHHALVDGAAAMQNLLLAAQALGLGSCWINQLRETCDDSAVRALLTEFGVPQDHLVVCSAAIGYIAEPTPAKERKENIISFND